MISRRKLIGGSAAAALSVPLLARTFGGSAVAATPATLPLALLNTTTSNTVYAYVLGRDAAAGGNWAFVRSGGSGLYHPPSPANDQTPLGEDCAIALNGPNAGARTVTLPHLYSGRIYFSVGSKLTFLMNRGGGLVLPSTSNPNDPNIDIRHDFCEFTLNNDQLYANITFVDGVGLPIAFDLQTPQGTQHVAGLPAGGLDTVANALRAQGGDWPQLIVPASGGGTLRVVSPNLAIQQNNSLFSGYLDDYVNRAWDRYRSTDLRIDTQFTWGVITGRVSGDVLNFPGVGSFTKPSTWAIFNCSRPPFTTANDRMGNISARLAAALNRTTLLDNAFQPTNENPANFYNQARTNHYARIMHETTPDGLGYAFPYDDVHPSGVDFEGKVQSGSPQHWTINVGGRGGSTNPGGFDPYANTPAVNYTDQHGTQTEGSSEGGENVGWIARGDWLKYSGARFGSDGAVELWVRVASQAARGGWVELRLDNVNNAPVGRFWVDSTGSWQTWISQRMTFPRITGTHDVYLYFNTDHANDFVNVHRFQFDHS